MVKHNKIIPNQHFHKKWASSSRGPLKVKVNLDQPGKKKARRLKRAAKAAVNAPRPADRLRPLVRCQTQQHNAKVRLGRGFSLAELKAAKISPRFAASVGIAVDHRRTNKSQEALDTNVQRLTDYKAKLVVFPRKGAAPKVAGALASLPKAAAPAAAAVEFVSVTDDMKGAAAYQAQRGVFQEKRMAGTRKRMAREAKNDKKKK
jgi:large subunit ribosomal protein L13e